MASPPFANVISSPVLVTLKSKYMLAALFQKIKGSLKRKGGVVPNKMVFSFDNCGERLDLSNSGYRTEEKYNPCSCPHFQPNTTSYCSFPETLEGIQEEMRFEQAIEGGAGNSETGPDLEGLATHASETVGGACIGEVQHRESSAGSRRDVWEGI